MTLYAPDAILWQEAEQIGQVMLETLQQKPGWLLWKTCCDEGSWIFHPSADAHHLTLEESSKQRPRGMATDGHYYFEAPKHSDFTVIMEILRQGLLKGLR